MIKFLKAVLLLLTGFLLIATIFMIREDFKTSEKMATDGQSIISVGIWITMRLGIITINTLISFSLIILLLLKKLKVAIIYYAILFANILVGCLNYFFLNY